MKVLVAVKRVPDFKTQVRVKSDGSGIETSNIKMSMNPFDEIAVEEAVRLKEKGKITEIIAVTIGNIQTQEVLRTALAMGADKGIWVQTDKEIQALAAAKILKAITLKEGPQLVILGKQSIDTDNNQTGQMLAGLLNWPQGTFASEVVLEEKSVRVTREIDGGLETLLLQLPAVVTTDLRLNEPRFISLPNIVAAKKKPIETIAAETLHLDLNPRIRLVKMKVPERKRHSVRLDSVAELVKRLKEEAQVLS